MGADLQLFVLKPHGRYETFWMCLNVLELDRDYRLWDAVRACKPVVVPPTVTVTMGGECGLKECSHDAYGERLTYLRAEDLADIEPPDGCTVWNWAVLKFLRAVPRDTLVVLWWH